MDEALSIIPLPDMLDVIARLYQTNSMNFFKTKTQNRSWVLLLLALLLTTGLSLWSQWPGISEPYSIQDDFRNFYWMHRFEDASLFPDDPFIGGSIVGGQVGPINLVVDISRPGYGLLFYLGSGLFDIVTLHKLLVFPLMLVSVFYLFRIGELLRGSGTGFALAMAFVVLNLASRSDISVASGLPRSFAAPILLGLVYYLMQERTKSALIVLVISSLIYLPVFLLGAVTYGLAALEPADNRWRFRIRWRRIAWLIALFVAAALLLSPLVIGRISNLLHAFMERADGSTSILADPGYSSGGRWNLITVFPFLGLGGLFSKIGGFWQSLSLVVLSLALWIQVPQAVGKYPRTLKNLFVASFLLFGLAWFFVLIFSSLTLYFPSRYTRISLFLVFLIFAVVNMEEGLSAAAGKLRWLWTWQKGLILLLLILIGAVMGSLFKDSSLTILRRMPVGDYSYTFIVATMLLVASILIAAMSSRNTSSRDVEPAAKIPTPVWLVLGAVLLMGSTFLIPRNRENFQFIGPAGQEVLSAIESLPVDVLISGEPNWLSFVPMFAKRTVLRSSEHYRRGTDAAMLATLEAYYAESFDEIVDYCGDYGVAYIVVVPWTLTEDRIRDGWLFFEPYNSLVHDKIAGQANFALMDIPKNLPLVNASGFMLLPCWAEAPLGDTG